MSDHRTDVAEWWSAAFDGDRSQLLDLGATRNINAVERVRCDLDVARKSSQRRRERNDEDGGRAMAEEGVGGCDDRWPCEASLGTDRRSEVDMNDVPEVQGSAQVGAEPYIAIRNVGRPRIGIGPQCGRSVGHLSIELIPPQGFERRVKRLGHRTRTLFGQLTQ